MKFTLVIYNNPEELANKIRGKIVVQATKRSLDRVLTGSNRTMNFTYVSSVEFSDTEDGYIYIVGVGHAPSVQPVAGDVDTSMLYIVEQSARIYITED